MYIPRKCIHFPLNDYDDDDFNATDETCTDGKKRVKV